MSIDVSKKTREDLAQRGYKIVGEREWYFFYGALLKARNKDEEISKIQNIVQELSLGPGTLIIPDSFQCNI